jgi:type IV pilus assembly protein PilE
MELMIVLVILTVLAGLAVPSYRQTIERTRASEAIANLEIIHAGQKIFKLDQGSYWPASGSATCNAPATCTAMNAALNTDVETEFYNLTVGSSSAAAYTAKAERAGGSKWYQINQTGTMTSGGSF